MAKREKAAVQEPADTNTAPGGAGEGMEALEEEVTRLRAKLAEQEAELTQLRRVIEDAVQEVEGETYRLVGKRSVAGDGFRYAWGAEITRADYLALPKGVRAFFEVVEQAGRVLPGG